MFNRCLSELGCGGGGRLLGRLVAVVVVRCAQDDSGVEGEVGHNIASTNLY